jgi:hypothetical protein
MFKHLFTAKVVGSVVRHTITAVGAFFVSTGFVDPVTDAAALEAIAGGAVALSGLFLSFGEKRKR